MQSVTEKKGCSQFISLFSQRTSIRGIPKLASSKYTSIKWFWSLFIVLAFLVMATVVALLVDRYLQYDTVIKTTSRKAERNDFPEMTVCSRLFFRSTTDNDEQFKIRDAYVNEVYSKFTDEMRKQNYSQANNIVFNDMKISSFVYKHLSFIQNRTNRLAAEYKNMCSLMVWQGNANYIEIPECSIRAVYNDRYVNCLAFSYPQRSTFLVSERMELKVNLYFVDNQPNAIVDKFKMDEQTAFNLHEITYKPVNVFINPVSVYPFDVKFEVPFTCDQANVYVVEVSKVIKSESLFQGRPKTCKNDPYEFNSFGVPFSVTNDQICKSIKTQESIIRSCGCYISFPSKQGTSDLTTLSCNINETLTRCYQKIDSLREGVGDPSCLPLCTETVYTTKHNARSFFYSNYSRFLYTYLETSSDCTVPNQRYCKELPACILKDLFEQYANTSCLYPSPVSTTIYDCSISSLTVTLTPMVTIKTESLVVEISTLLSQISGVCAFFTGLTFTFIAEVIEAIIIWRMSRRSLSDT